jgi:hypothetical protein
MLAKATLYSLLSMCVLAGIDLSDVAGGDGAALSPRPASGLLAPTRDGEDPSSLANMKPPREDALPAVAEAPPRRRPQR